MNKEDKYQMVTIRVPKEVLEAFDKTCPKGGRAEKLRSMMEKEACTSQGDFIKSFNLEARIAEKSQLLRKEWEQQAFLEKILLRDRFSSREKTAWEVLSRFFESLEDKKQHAKSRLSIADYKDLRNKMLNLKLTGDEPFSNSERLLFIHRLDYKIKRLTLEKEIEAHLQNQNADGMPSQEIVADEETKGAADTELNVQEHEQPNAEISLVDDEVVRPSEIESDTREEEDQQAEVIEDEQEPTEEDDEEDAEPSEDEDFS
jgi:hypothetical protein